MKEQTSPAIPRWWKSITHQITSQKYYECPISGRRRYFKGGFKRNELLNNPIQMGVASHMNRATRRIARRLPTTAGIVMQVHDMLGVECDQADTHAVVEIQREELSQPFPLPGFPEARLPPDPPAVGRYVDQI
jgi:DNA polymerase I-like protein with 3'-5' exonuclease and polymerase domains